MAATEEQTDPRSLVRVLMRGDHATGRVGERGEKAALAACDSLGIVEEPAALALLGYAYGFAVALNLEPLDTAAGLCEHYMAAVGQGYADGSGEDAQAILPARVPT